MTSQRLTAIAVEKAKPRRTAGGEPVRTEIPDAGCPGLFLIVQPSRVKSWALRYRYHGKPAKLTLGPVAMVEGITGLTLAGARRAAAAARHEIEQGIDPASSRRAARAAEAEQAALRKQDSVEALTAQFIELHAKRKVRPRTLAQYESVLRRLVLPVWKGRTVHDIRRRDVIALVENIAVDRPIMANRTLGVLSKFFAWMVARDMIAASPVHGVEPPAKENARDRTLDDGEVAALWAACGEEGVFGAAVRVMLAVGARRSEVAGMRWDEIDTERRSWTLPATRSKNRHALTIPLSPLVWKIITSVPRISNEYIFSATGDGPISNFHRIKDKLDAKLKFAQPWVIHDLRRSTASGLQRLGVRVEVIEAALGHLSGSRAGIVGRYQRHDYSAEVRAALERWADHIEQLVTGKPAKILPMRGR